MAADWIKMRTDLYRDPKVCLMADFLCCRDSNVPRNVMRNATVGALVTVWGVTRHRGKRSGDDLIVHGITLGVLDDMADLPGFGSAMEAAGWAHGCEEGVIFPHFFEDWNIDPQDTAKKNNAERQRRFREKRNASRNVTVTSQSNGREEKSREEKSIQGETPLPPCEPARKKVVKEEPITIPQALDTPEFRQAWLTWLQHRKEKRSPVTPTAQKQQIKKLSSMGLEKAIEALEHSTAQSYTGVFEPSTNGTPARKEKESPFDQALREKQEREAREREQL